MRSLDFIQLASEKLNEAEELLEYNNSHVKELSKRTVLYSIEAVAQELGVEPLNILDGLNILPLRLWSEVLRLLEIKRMIDVSTPKDALELAREAVEIATALILYVKF